MILLDEGLGSSSLLSYPPLSSLALLCRLPSPPFSDARADFSFTGRGPDSTPISIGGEVKKLTELAGALRTGRLQATQLPALLHLYDVRWLLIITGSSRRNPETGALQTLRTIAQGQGEKKEKVRAWADWDLAGDTIPYNYVSRFLSSPSFTQFKDENGEGVHVWSVYDEREAAAWIGDLWELWQREYETHSSMRVLDRSGNQNGHTEADVRKKLKALHDPRFQDPKFAQRVRTFSSLPNISYARAIAMAEEFESVQKGISPLCTCRVEAPEEEVRKWRKLEEKQWERVRGVGRGIAAEIGKAVR